MAGLEIKPLPYGATQTPRLGVQTPGFAQPVARPRPEAAIAQVAYNPGTKEFFVGGRTFSEDDEATAVEAVNWMGQSNSPPPPGFEPVASSDYAAFVSAITNPTMGRLASRNFGIGVDNAQMLAGRGMQFLGAEESGQRVVASQLEDLRKTSPYQRQFSDIGSDPNRGVLDWFVANLAQQGPNMIESAVSAAVGFAAGSATGGGPISGAGGAILSLVGKQSFKAAVTAAGKKYAAGEALSAAETKLLKEAAGIVGAAVATTGQNYATGVADIYGEGMESGAPSRGAAALGAIPYAALESTGEFLLGMRLFGDLGKRAGKVADTTPYRSKATDLLKGLGAGAAIEGTTEAGQEALLLAANPAVDWDSAEGITRLINSFAAGAAVGGPIGGLANLRSRNQPTDMLNPNGSLDPKAANIPGQEPAEQLQIGRDAPPLQLTYQPEPPANPPDVIYGGGAPQPQIGQQRPGLLPPPSDIKLPDRSASLAPFSEQPQGMLDLQGGTGVQPLVQSPPPVAPAPVAPDPAQGFLQPQKDVSREAPPLEANAMSNKLLQLKRDMELRQAQAQRAQQPAPPTAAEVDYADALAGQSVQLDPEAAVTGKNAVLDGHRRKTIAGFNSLTAEQQDKILSQEEFGNDINKFMEIVQRATKTTVLQKAIAGYAGVPVETFSKATVKVNVAAEPEPAVAPAQPVLKAASETAAAAPAPVEAAAPAPVVAQPEPANAPVKKAVLLKKKEAPAEAAPVVETPPAPVAQAEPVVEAPKKKMLGFKRVSPETEPAPKPVGEGAAKLKKAGYVAKSAVETEKPAPKAKREENPAVAKAQEELSNMRTDDVSKAKLRKAISRYALQGLLTAKDVKSYDTMFADKDMSAADDIVPEVQADIARNYVTGATDAEVKDVKTPFPQGKPQPQASSPKEASPKKREDTGSEKLGDRSSEEELNDLIATADNEKDFLVRTMALSGILEMGYGNTGENDKTANALRLKAQEYLENWEGNASKLWLNALMHAAGGDKFQPFSGGKPSKFLGLILGTPGGFQQMMLTIDATDKTKERIRQIAQQDFPELNITALDLPPTAVQLAEAIEQFNAANYTSMPSTKTLSRMVLLLKAAREADALKTVWPEGGTPLSEYFVGTKPRIVRDRETDVLRIVPEGRAMFSLQDWNVAKGQVNTAGDKITPLSIGRIKLGVSSFLSNMLTKPNVRVFKNQADLKEQEPALYRRALRSRYSGRAARTDKMWDWISAVKFNGKVYTTDDVGGEMHADIIQWLAKKNKRTMDEIDALLEEDNALGHYDRRTKEYVGFEEQDEDVGVRADIDKEFDTANAAGFSMAGGEVFVFSDRIMSDAHLKFVLAHETIGHYGFRAVVPEGKLNATLRNIYENGTQDLRARVDYAMAARNMSLEEATEEYMADMAGSLDVSLVKRFFNGIKTFLNKLGISFEDDTLRYWLNKSRDYVRNGRGGHVFVNSEVAQAVQVFDGSDPYNTGRFSQTFYELNHDFANVTQQLDYGAKSTKEAFARRASALHGTYKKVINNLKLTNYHARENFGMKQVYDAVGKMSDMSKSLVNKYQRGMATTLHRAVEIGGMAFNGVNREQVRTAELMILHNSESKFFAMGGSELANLPQLIKFKSGEPVVDYEAFEQLKKMGRRTVEELRDGYTYFRSEPYEMTAEQRKKIEEERDALLATAQTDAEKKKINLRYEPELKAGFYMGKTEVKVKGIPGLTEKSVEWKMYNEMLDTLAEAHVDKVISQYARSDGDWKNMFRRLRKAVGRELTASDKMFVNAVRIKYLELLNEGGFLQPNGSVQTTEEAVEKAEKFIVAVNRAVLSKESDLHDEALAAWPEAQRPAINDALKGYKENNQSRNATDETRFILQHEVANLTTLEREKASEETRAKRLIATGYAPTSRRGNWQTRVVAVDKDGKHLSMHPAFYNQMAYLQFDTKAEAEKAAEDFIEIFKDGTHKVSALDDTGTYTMQEVKLVAEATAIQHERNDPSRGNVHEFARFVVQFGIQLRPEKREKIVQLLTAQTDRTRKGFKREGVPGVSGEMARSVSEFLEMSASVVARNSHMPTVDGLLDDRSEDYNTTWMGSEEKYKELELAWKAAERDPTMSAEAKIVAKREFDEYHFMYKTMNSKQVGKQYADAAIRLVTAIQKQRDVALNDFANGEISGSIRNLTVVPILGGSAASAFLNLISVMTNVMPALATYNSKTSFGGGFGFGKAMSTIASASSSVGNPLANTVEYYQKLLDDKAARTKQGLSKAEVKYLIDFIGSGRGDAAAANSLMSTTRGRMTSGLRQQAVEKFMLPFTLTEQMSRRISGLAAFRLEYERNIAAGMEQKEAVAKATQFSNDLVDNAVGQYANHGVPMAFRGGVMQFLFMFKVFPVATFLMIRNLDWQGRVAVLGMLILLGGIKGIPFMDDFFDVLDTLCQQLLGLPIGSVEAEFYKLIDTAMPGAGYYFANGVLDGLTPATISTRTQVGNMIPGTAIFLPYTDRFREITDVMGPAASAMTQYIATAGSIGKYGLEAAGLKADTTSLVGIMRESPITMLRAIGDSIAYGEHGAIVDKRGYVVSREMSAGTIAARLLGFYPSAASEQFAPIRLGIRIANYQKDVSMSFRHAWLKARATGDNETMRRIERDVRDWNEAAESHGLGIPNFRKNADRAYKEMQKPAGQRAVSALPKNSRDQAETLMKIFTD